MTRLFRSRYSRLVGLNDTAPTLRPETDAQHGDKEELGYESEDCEKPISTPLINHGSREAEQRHGDGHQFAIVDILAAALRKSIVTCSVERDDSQSPMDISYPTDVRHLSHVTFDRFDGFLGLPVELQPELPMKPPSASVSVFGDSANSMQCSYNDRGNNVPTILLMMQNQLYYEGGLKAEGIFRINAENSPEEYVREHLNKGVVPSAWLRELPTGVLDRLTPEQVMHRNTKDDCTQLMKLLSPTEAALLDWAVNLMTDVVQHQQCNKMNARNIAMVFAPNMTQMADPLTALIHAVQVMNFLKTLILKIVREKIESATKSNMLTAQSGSDTKGELHPSNSNSNEQSEESHASATDNNMLRTATLDRLESDNEETFWSFGEKSDGDESISEYSTPATCRNEGVENSYKVDMITETGSV